MRLKSFLWRELSRLGIPQPRNVRGQRGKKEKINFEGVDEEMLKKLFEVYQKKFVPPQRTRGRKPADSFNRFIAILHIRHGLDPEVCKIDRKAYKKKKAKEYYEKRKEMLKTMDKEECGRILKKRKDNQRRYREKNPERAKLWSRRGNRQYLLKKYKKRLETPTLPEWYKKKLRCAIFHTELGIKEDGILLKKMKEIKVEK